MARTMRAVLIGANAAAGVNPVPEALDAVHIATGFLVHRFGSAGTLNPPSRIVSLINAAPTKLAVDTALADAAKDSADGDLFILLFSGHGGNPQTEQYFLLNDDGFTDSDLANAINAFDPDVEIVVIADCCYAAKMFHPGPTIHPPGIPAIPGIPHVPHVPHVPGMPPVPVIPHVPVIPGFPDPPADPSQFRKDLRSWLRKRQTAVFAKLAAPARFVLAASASGIQRHANAQSEFVRTLADAVPNTNRYKHLLAEMKALVPKPAEQANWSVDGRPEASLERKAFKKT
jgi:hypothetical protein